MIFFREKYSSCSDEKLMRDLQQGEVQAFSELYRRYSKRMLYYFYRMLGNDQLKAQDFLHDLFLKLLERPELYDSTKKFSSWLFSIACNLCKNEYRRLAVRRHYSEKVQVTEIPQDLNEESRVENRLDQEKFRKALFAELESVEPDHKQIFLLRFQENFSIREIAQILDCKEGTVRSRLFYLIRKLAENLSEFHPMLNEVETNDKIKSA
jgi:RNA polymerase sigma-70 factor (ECF subfamily)